MKQWFSFSNFVLCCTLLSQCPKVLSKEHRVAGFLPLNHTYVGKFSLQLLHWYQYLWKLRIRGWWRTGFQYLLGGSSHRSFRKSKLVLNWIGARCNTFSAFLLVGDWYCYYTYLIYLFKQCLTASMFNLFSFFCLFIFFFNLSQISSLWRWILVSQIQL